MNDRSRLKEINIENIILFIYYFIITLSLIDNYIEKRYIIFKNEQDKKTYRFLLFIIFGIAFLIYLYYTISGINGLKNITDPKVRELSELSVLANFLVLISGAIYLYIIYQDQEINVELVFS